MRIVCNNNEEHTVHLMDLIPKIDYVFISYETLCVTATETIYGTENMDYQTMSTEDIAKLPSEERALITDVDVLDRLIKYDKRLLTNPQRELLEPLYDKLRIIADSSDAKELIEKIKKCTDYYWINSNRTAKFKEKYHLSGRDLLEILKNVKFETFAYYKYSKCSADIGTEQMGTSIDYFSDKLFVYTPIMSYTTSSGVTISDTPIYVKIDKDKTTNDTVVYISLHITDLVEFQPNNPDSLYGVWFNDIHRNNMEYLIIDKKDRIHKFENLLKEYERLFKLYSNDDDYIKYKDALNSIYYEINNDADTVSGVTSRQISDGIYYYDEPDVDYKIGVKVLNPNHIYNITYIDDEDE